MYLKTKKGTIYIVIGRKNLKWLCILPYIENPDDLLDIPERKEVLIDKRDVGIISKDYNKVKKFLYLRKAYSYKWFTCINNRHEFFGVSYHCSNTEAMLFKQKQKRSNSSFYTEEVLPRIKIVSEDLLEEVMKKKSILIHNKLTNRHYVQ